MIFRHLGCLIAAIVVLAGCQNLFNPPDEPFDGTGATDRITERTASPVFLRASGTYSTDFDVAITSQTGGATVYYTIGDSPDDPDPGETGTQEYTVPIEIVGDGTEVTIKAIAVADGFRNSLVSLAWYAIRYPGDPVDPTDPEDPEDPENPVDPEDPEDPEEPTDPEDPEEPIDPEDPEDPIDPIDPEDPEDPVDPEPVPDP